MIYDISSDRTTLFVPPVDAEDILWSGMPSAPEELLAKYDIDAVFPNTDLQATLDLIGRKACQNNGTTFTFADHHEYDIGLPKGLKVNSTILEEAIDECRVNKDEYEIALVQKACDISSAAHRAVIESVKGSRNEAELDGVVLGECTKRGAKIQAYPSIVASGRTAVTMHYESNNQDLYINGQAKDVVVMDAGAECNCYGADITRTLPISGKFTRQSRSIYDLVLKMQENCIDMLKEGVL
ncbi:hypothetical protein NW762_012375 [Fusarium torreyae]|uniref:Xaa-Pro aminopeptidase n=1 Tax=Fusarium torreyae TaxID=1237075 RepID=A0A9W8VBD2_9HYPO|nr:hypothetical protein NW762_012375 [Fusarium torreyae]